LKNFYFTRTESKKNNLKGAKPKVSYITGGKTLLTLSFIGIYKINFHCLLVIEKMKKRAN